MGISVPDQRYVAEAFTAMLKTLSERGRVTIVFRPVAGDDVLIVSNDELERVAQHVAAAAPLAVTVQPVAAQRKAAC